MNQALVEAILLSEKGYFNSKHLTDVDFVQAHWNYQSFFTKSTLATRAIVMLNSYFDEKVNATAFQEQLSLFYELAEDTENVPEHLRNILLELLPVKPTFASNDDIDAKN